MKIEINNPEIKKLAIACSSLMFYFEYIGACQIT